MEKGIIICGEYRECRANKDILKETVDWLIDRGMINNDDAPLIERNIRYVINDEPVHTNGTDFSSEYYLNKVDLYLETNWDVGAIKEISEKLLKVNGLNEDVLKIVKTEEVNRF